MESQPSKAKVRRAWFAMLGLALLGLSSASSLAQPHPPETEVLPAESREAIEWRARQLNLQSGYLARQRRFAEAIPVAREALELSEQLHGKVHPNIAADLFTLASLYRAQGDLFNAEPLIQRAIGIDRQLYGERHPEVGADLMVLGQLQQDRSDRTAAERTYRESIAMLGAPGASAKYQLQLAQAHYLLGMLLRNERRPAEANTEFAAAVPVLEREAPAMAVEALLIMAEFERTNGRQARAQALLDRANQLRSR